MQKTRKSDERKFWKKFGVKKRGRAAYLGDETLLRLIAAKYGVEVEQNGISNSGTLSTSRLLAGLNDVTVAGRLIAVFPVRTFEGEKPGKIATLMVADKEGTLRVMLWNEKADLVEHGELKAGQVVRLVHGYTRMDRLGKVELHLGSKSRIEAESPEKASEYPTIDKFITKIGALNSASGAVHLLGVVREIFSLSNFKRADSSDGAVMRFILADDSGQATMVAWNDKASELQKSLKANTHLQVINARVKDSQNGTFEVHVDSNTCINIDPAS